MEVIKFRAWDRKTKTMLTMSLDTNFGISRFFGFLPAHAVLMQFTGLKKKGQDVYAGDICQVENQDCEQIVGVVEYFEGMGQWFVAREDADDEPLWEYDYEVIGNIHENPELIK